MSQQPASQAAVIDEAERVKTLLARRFGSPPPEPRLRALTDEDKAAVASVTGTPAHTGDVPGGPAEEHVSSAAADLRALTSDLRKSDPEAAKLAEQQAERIENLA